MRKVQLSRINFTKKTIEERKDFVAEETAIHIYLNNIHYGTILCSPDQLEEMVIGHLLSQGLVKSTDEIEDLLLKEAGKCLVKLESGIDAETRISSSQRLARLVVSSCGFPDYWPLSDLINSLSLTQLEIAPIVEAEVILRSVMRLNTIAKQFRETGGVHVAALYSMDGQLATLAEDVGRHNAVDKVIGAGLNKNIDFRDFFLASSGRLTGDIVLKAARMKIPLIASLAAALSSGLEVAKLTGITLVGFVKSRRMNVYTYPERIKFRSRGAKH